jgi:hypothetical protein
VGGSFFRGREAGGGIGLVGEIWVWEGTRMSATAMVWVGECDTGDGTTGAMYSGDGCDG